MTVQIRVNAAVLAGWLVCVLISYFWYSDVMPWSKYTEGRYFIPALVADFGLSVLIQWIICSHWGIRKIQDAVALGLYASLLYIALAAPHSLVGPSSGIALVLDGLHKFSIVTAITFTQHSVKKAGY